MAIEDTFKELQAVRRGQYERIREQQRKQQRTDTMFAATNVLTRIGNAFLREQAANFINNEDNMARKAKYRSFLNTANNTIEEYKQAEKFDGGVEAYLINKRKNFLMNDAQQEYAELSELKETELNKYINDQATQWASQNVKKFKDEYNSALQLGSYEDYEAALAQEYQGPRNVGEFLWRGAKGFFAGKNKNQIRAANVQSTRAALMEQAGREVQGFDAAVNAGYDIDSAVAIQSAIDDKKINRKEDVLISTEYVDEVSRRHGGDLSITYTVETYETASGEKRVERKLEAKDNINPNNKYALQAATEAGIDPNSFIIKPPKVETKDNEWGVPVTTSTSDVIDPYGIKVDEISYRVFDLAEDTTLAMSRVTDTERLQISNANNMLAGIRTYKNNMTETYAGLAEAYYTQGLGDTATADQLNDARKLFQAETAGELRVLINKIATSAGQPEQSSMFVQSATGQVTPVSMASEKIMDIYHSDLAPLYTMSKLRSINSKRSEDGKVFEEEIKGFDLKPENAALDMLVSLVSLENSNTPVDVNPETLRYLFDNINVADIPNLPKNYRTNLLNSITRTESVADWMDTATANPEYYFKRGYSSFDVGNIMRIAAMLDKSTQARVFERTRRDIDEEEKKLIRLGRTRSPQV
jgi:hypothetical protein